MQSRKHEIGPSVSADAALGSHFVIVQSPKGTYVDVTRCACEHVMYTVGVYLVFTSSFPVTVTAATLRRP
jgi:hypothetical protein